MTLMAKNAPAVGQEAKYEHTSMLRDLAPPETKTVHHMGTVRRARDRRRPTPQKIYPAPNPASSEATSRSTRWCLFVALRPTVSWRWLAPERDTARDGTGRRAGGSFALVKEPANVEGKHGTQKQKHHQKDRRQRGGVKYPENSQETQYRPFSLACLLVHHWSPIEHRIQARATRTFRAIATKRLVFINHHLPPVDDDRSGAHGFDFFQDVRRQHNGFALAGGPISEIRIQLRAFDSVEDAPNSSSKIKPWSCRMAWANPTRRLNPLDSVSMVLPTTGCK